MTQDAALQCLMQQVEAGLDVVVEGAPEAVRSLLARAGESLRNSCTVVQVAAPTGGLSLSSLMAQLSRRTDFDGQDDAVLELGFRRLAVPEIAGQRTALLLDGANGVQRPVLRYLQHVGRSAPGLVYVIAGCSDLQAMLAEAGSSPLRARLTVRPALMLGQQDGEGSEEPAAEADAAVIAAVAALAVQPRTRLAVVSAPLAQEAAAAVRPLASRRMLPWAVFGTGMAASLALGAWLGHASQHQPEQPKAVAALGVPAASPETSGRDAVRPRAGGRDRIDPAMPIETATATSPGLAGAPPIDVAPINVAPVDRSSGAPALVAAPHPRLAHAIQPDSAASAPPATVPSSTPVLASGGPEAVPAGEPPARAQADGSAFELYEPVPPTQMDLADVDSMAEPKAPALAPRSAAPATRAGEERRRADAARAKTASLARPAPPGSADHLLHAPSRRWDNLATSERRSRWPQPDGREPDAREPETARYDWSYREPRRSYEGAADWRGARYAPAPEGPYVGTYTAGPYGTRVFRYEQP